MGEKMLEIIKDDRDNINTKVWFPWTTNVNGVQGGGVPFHQWKSMCETTHKCDEDAVGKFDYNYFEKWAREGNDGKRMVELDGTGEELFRGENCALWLCEVTMLWMDKESHEWKMIVKDLQKNNATNEDIEERKMKELNKYLEHIVGAYAATANEPNREPRKKGFLEKMGDKAKDMIDTAVEKTA